MEAAMVAMVVAMVAMVVAMVAIVVAMVAMVSPPRRGAAAPAGLSPR